MIFSFHKLAILSIVIFGFILISFSTHVEGEKEIPVTKFGQNVGGPTMTFLYW